MSDRIETTGYRELDTSQPAMPVPILSAVCPRCDALLQTTAPPTVGAVASVRCKCGATVIVREQKP